MNRLWAQTLFELCCINQRKLFIDKLEGMKNWQLWKYQMQVILEAKELWGHVDGTATNPTSSESGSSNASAQSAFTKAQMKTKEIWDKLKERFERNTVGNKLFLKQKFFSLLLLLLKLYFTRVNTLQPEAEKLVALISFKISFKMKDSDSLNEHLHRMKEITDQLAAIKAPIPEDEHIVALLLSLPRSYNTVITALTAKGDEFSLAQVHQTLRSETWSMQGQRKCWSN